jgi:hypothetical protein
MRYYLVVILTAVFVAALARPPVLVDTRPPAIIVVAPPRPGWPSLVRPGPVDPCRGGGARG